jgi:hypothetical protein
MWVRRMCAAVPRFLPTFACFGSNDANATGQTRDTSANLHPLIHPNLCSAERLHPARSIRLVYQDHASGLRKYTKLTILVKSGYLHRDTKKIRFVLI